MELVDLDWIGQNCGEEGGDAEKVGVSKEDDDAGSGDGKQSSKNDTESKPDEEEQTGSGGMEWGGMDAGKWKKNSTGCRAFHLMPRFSRNLPGELAASLVCLSISIVHEWYRQVPKVSTHPFHQCHDGTEWATKSSDTHTSGLENNNHMKRQL